MLLGYNKQGKMFLDIFKEGVLFHLDRGTNSFNVSRIILFSLWAVAPLDRSFVALSPAPSNT